MARKKVAPKKVAAKKPRRAPRAAVSHITFSDCNFDGRGPDAEAVQELAKAIHANADAAHELAKGLKAASTVVNIGPSVSKDDD